MKGIVVGIGEALWDILPEGKKLGGAPANFAYIVSQFGLPSCVVSAIGQDSLGMKLKEDLSKKKLNLFFSEVPYPTGTVEVELDHSGVPCYNIMEDVAWDHIPFTEHLENLADNTKAVCFGSLAQRSEESRATICRFLKALSNNADCLKVFDVNLRQHFYTKDILHNSMIYCNILKINDEELDIVSKMFGCEDGDTEKQCRFFLDKYQLKILILTCGVKGSWVFVHGHSYFQPTPIVKVADTVGAGDSFTAAFVAGLLKGKSVEQSHQCAVNTSAFVCSQPGAMPILPPELVDS
ncbi:MAG: carbohydrate kinase [Muribaculum sp.]|nr:carbohydrate kinase [Muribaculum sp.]